MAPFYDHYSKNGPEIQVHKLREKKPDRDRPLKATPVFYTKDHYTILHAFSQIGEYDTKAALNELNRDRLASLRPVTVPRHVKDGVMSAYFFVATDHWDYDRMPAIGETFKLKLFANWTAPKARIKNRAARQASGLSTLLDPGTTHLPTFGVCARMRSSWIWLKSES